MLENKNESIVTIAKWNSLSYGKAIKLKKTYIKLFLSILCVVTPFTNWMIPIICRIIKNDYYLRY